MLAAGAALAATIPPPPPTPPATRSTTIQGVKVADPYRWLEDWNDPKVSGVERCAECAHARLSGCTARSRAPIKGELSRLIKATSPSFYDIAAARQPRVCDVQRSQIPAAHAGDDERRGRSEIAARTARSQQDGRKGLTAIDWFVPSATARRSRCRCRRTAARMARCTSMMWPPARKSIRRFARVQYPTAGGSLAWAAGRQGLLVHALSRRGCACRPSQHFNHAGLFPQARQRCGRRIQLVLGAKDGLERVSEVFLEQPLQPARRNGDGAARRRRRLGLLCAEGRRSAGRDRHVRGRCRLRGDRTGRRDLRHLAQELAPTARS